MSLYKRPGARTWSYDFRFKGHRFSGNTGKATRRDAESWLKAERARLAARAAAAPAHGRDLTLSNALVSYWHEVGQHHVNADSTDRDLARLRDWIGPATPLSHITDATVAALIARRRGEGVGPATVNRTLTQVLRKVLGRARRVWKVPVADIDWPAHMLAEPQERVRELTVAEQERLFAAMRPDYANAVLFALLTGCRRIEVVHLRWADVDWFNGLIKVRGKAGRVRRLPITPALKALLWPLQAHHPDRVFTYARQRAGGTRDTARGARVSVSMEGFKTDWRRAVKRAGLRDFRFHDLRHTMATRTLRHSNLRVVQNLLGHQDPKTTSRYAHVMADDMAQALDSAAQAYGLSGVDDTGSDEGGQETG